MKTSDLLIPNLDVKTLHPVTVLKKTVTTNFTDTFKK
jgi:hypothetical protein